MCVSECVLACVFVSVCVCVCERDTDNRSKDTMVEVCICFTKNNGFFSCALMVNGVLFFLC